MSLTKTLEIIDIYMKKTVDYNCNSPFKYYENHHNQLEKWNKNNYLKKRFKRSA